MHPVLHVSLLMKYVGDPASVVPLASVAVKYSLSFENVLDEILYHQIRWLRNKKSLQSRFYVGVSPEREILGKQK